MRPSPMGRPGLLTLAGVAQYLQISEGDVRQLIDAEDLHAIELGPGVLRVAPRDLREFLEVRRRGFRPRLHPDSDCLELVQENSET